MATDFYVKQNDTADAILIKLLDENGTPIPDMDNAVSVEFRMRRTDLSKIVWGDMTIVDPQEAIVKYQWKDGDTDTIGTYEGVVVVSYGGGMKRTIPTIGFITIEVTDNIETSPAMVSIDMPPETPLIFGDGQFVWTPTVVDDDQPIAGRVFRSYQPMESLTDRQRPTQTGVVSPAMGLEPLESTPAYTPL